MITLLGSLIGFLSSLFPEIIKFFGDKADKAHELAVMDKQIEMAKMNIQAKLDEINIQADVQESEAIYKTYNSGVRWVDALNGIVRPFVAFALVFEYVWIKFLVYQHLNDAAAPVAFMIETMHDNEDMAIFAGVLSFYFGNRAMSKLRQ